MAERVSSVSLAVGSITTPGYGLAAVCPAGATLLVKSLAASSSATAVTDLRLTVVRQDPLTGVNLVWEPLAAFKALFREVWAVLHPGDFVWVYSDAAPVDYWISGSILYGVADWTRPTTFPGMEALPASTPK